MQQLLTVIITKHTLNWKGINVQSIHWDTLGFLGHILRSWSSKPAFGGSR